MIKSYNEFVIPSEINNLPLVQEYVERVCCLHNVADYVGIVSVAVLAAVENAIVHGNKSDIRKEVRITYSCRNAAISFRIEDEGRGFDYKKHTIKSAQNRGGNGIFLMEKLCDSFNFVGTGNIVELHFSTTPMKADASMGRIKVMTQYFAEWKNQQPFSN